MKLPMLSPDDKLVEIRRLYFKTSRQTIQADFDRAVQLLKSMNSEDERERATVYMEGLAEMRRDWVSPRPSGSPKRANRAGASGTDAKKGARGR